MRQIVPLPAFVIDAGNAFVKYVVGEVEGSFVHRIALLTPSEYDSGMSRYGKSALFDFLRLDGNVYAVGQTAENYQVQRRIRAPKYERDYYGVLFAASIGRAFASNPLALKGGLRVVASHASSDYEFHQNLINSIKGRWKFEIAGIKFDFNVTEVNTYEEPFGSYARCAFQFNHKRQWVTPLHGLAAGIMDIGGGTSGVLQVDQNGIVRYGQSESGSQGMNSVVERLASLLKTDFKPKLGRVIQLNEERLRNTLKTGVYVGGGHQIPCAEQVKLACAPLLNEIENMYLSRMGGGDNVDVLILTGGGNAILHEHVTELLGHGNTILADDTDQIQFANVRGAKTFYQVLEEML